MLAEHITKSISPDVSEALSQQAMKAFDDNLLEPSELDAEKKDNIQAIFLKLQKEIQDNTNTE